MADRSPVSALSKELWLLEDLEVDELDKVDNSVNKVLLCIAERDMGHYPVSKFLREYAPKRRDSEMQLVRHGWHHFWAMA